MFVEQFRHFLRGIHAFEPRRGVEDVLNRGEPVSVEDQERVEIEASQAFTIELFHRTVEGRDSPAHVRFALGLAKNHQARDMGCEHCGADLAHISPPLLARGTVAPVPSTVPYRKCYKHRTPYAPT